jgi:hypothetical protein
MDSTIIDNGMHSAIHDHYHGLTVVLPAGEDVCQRFGNPWIDEIGVFEGDWDCDYATWLVNFSARVPNETFRAPLSELLIYDELLRDVVFECIDGDWVVRGAEPRPFRTYWAEVIENGWAQFDDEGMPTLRFSTEVAAKSALCQARRMYAERETRFEEAIALLGRTANGL